ncbi:MAG: hypothetical protein D6801_10515 [Alphaproteobacteria bacterium]|nr:MAG: hypothetical protein D6801_10515 [Alphaproteobacteria bacterium]
MDLVWRMWRAAPVATVVLALALAAFAVFAGRSVAFWVYWHDPAHREQVISGWMTPGYVAHSWHVPREVVLKALDLPAAPPKRRMSLDEIAAERGVPTEELIGEVERAIAAYRAGAGKVGGGPEAPR